MAWIETQWPRYFETRDEGLGTLYERRVLHRIFGEIARSFRPQGLVEVPCLGMTGITGINSLWWARRGCWVTIVDHHEGRLGRIRDLWQETGLRADLVCAGGTFEALPFADKACDMAWNFCALDHVPDPGALLSEMARIARRLILLCLPNPANPLVRRRGGSFGPPEAQRALQALGWRLACSDLFDVPPWPDIAMGKEDLMEALGFPGLARQWREKKTPGGPLSILDGFLGRKDRTEFLDRVGFLERAPLVFRRIWAHHRYLLFLPNG